MDGGWERNGCRAAQEADADNNVMNCLWKGSSKAAQATLALPCSVLPVDPAGGQAIPLLYCPYLLSSSGKREGWSGRDY